MMYKTKILAMIKEEDNMDTIVLDDGIEYAIVREGIGLLVVELSYQV